MMVLLQKWGPSHLDGDFRHDAVGHYDDEAHDGPLAEVGPQQLQHFLRGDVHQAVQTGHQGVQDGPRGGEGGGGGARVFRHLLGVEFLGLF
jgi:hypothetical protein